MLPIIDTHQHLWDLEKFNLPWVQSEQGLNRSFLMEDYLEAASGLNVVGTLYTEVDVAPQQQRAEADYVVALCEDSTALMVGAVISGRPAAAGFENYISLYKNNPHVKGVRQVLHVADAPPGTCLSDVFVRGVRLLGELGKSFDLCLRPTELLDGVKLADQCPQTRLIVDHCGNADPTAFGSEGSDPPPGAWHAAEPWRRAIAQLAQRENVICKISGIVVRAAKGTWTAEDLAPIINHCLDEFGPDRVVFGSDWPVCTLVTGYAHWVEALQQVMSDRDETQQRKLFCDNAVRLYGLPGLS